MWAESVWRYLSVLPPAGRSLAAAAFGLARPATFDSWFRTLDGLLPQLLRQRIPGDKLQKLAGSLAATSADDLFFRLASTWQDPASVVLGSTPQDAALPDGSTHIADFAERMMCVDTLTYLPDDILVKVDRAAMGVSLETRVPILDPDVARFAWSLPKRLKIRSGKGKWILREVLAKYLPRALFERPKMGFGVPIDSWLRGPLRAWAENGLSEDRLRREGYFDPRPIRTKWEEHLSGRRNWQHHLWTVLMFQAWQEHGRRVSDAAATQAAPDAASGALRDAS